MFANRTRLSRPTIEQLASKVGLDMPRFEKDWPSQETANTVIRDMQDGEKAGVEGTPSIFVNGKHYRGSLELAPFSKIIEGELKK
jgi:protein-disulfide isomerase